MPHTEPDTRTPEWHGTYLTEDEIVADILANIKKHDAAAMWLDPAAWRMPSFGPDYSPIPAEEGRDIRGALLFVGRDIRNWYGLWHPDCPITVLGGDELEITDDIITDPRFPDNLSGRIMDRVRAILKELDDAERDSHS